MAALHRRLSLLVFVPWLIIVFFAAGCEHLEINGPRQPGSGGSITTDTLPGDEGAIDEGLYPAPEGGRVGGPPPPARDVVRVGLLLPLTGPQAALGKAMRNAAELALFDLGDRRFELLPYDTRGTPEGAAAAAQLALDDGGALLLGPLLASSTRAVAPIAHAARVPVIAFTSDSTAAEPGVFVLGFTPQAEVRRVLAYAADNGLDRIAVLAPQDAYGNAVAAAAKDAAAAVGVRLVRTQFYEPSARDFGPAVEGVTRSGTGQSFDALLIADGGERLRAIGAYLPVRGLQPPKVRVLGTGAWDDQSVGREQGLVGGWYAAPAPDYREAFSAQYREAFGEAPPRLATLSYDAAALAAVLARNPGFFPFDETAIADPKGFLGRDGIFRFGPDGVAQRGLAVLEVERTGSRVISPAPTDFGGS